MKPRFETPLLLGVLWLALLFALLPGSALASPAFGGSGVLEWEAEPVLEEPVVENLRDFYLQAVTQRVRPVLEPGVAVRKADRFDFDLDLDLTPVRAEVQPYWDPDVIEGGPALDLDPRFLLGMRFLGPLAVFIDGEDLVPGSQTPPWPTDSIVHFGVAFDLVEDIDVRLYPSVNLEITPFGVEDHSRRELATHAPHRAVAELAWRYGTARVRAGLSADRPHDGRPTQPGGWLFFELRF